MLSGSEEDSPFHSKLVLWSMQRAHSADYTFTKVAPPVGAGAGERLRGCYRFFIVSVIATCRSIICGVHF